MNHPRSNIIKTLSYVLCLALIFALAAPPRAHADGLNNFSVLNGEEIGIVMDACAADGDLYILSNLGIYLAEDDQANAPLKKIIDLVPFQRETLTPWEPESSFERGLWEQGVGRLFALGGSLWGLHPYTGKISQLAGDSMLPVTTIPEDQLYYTDQGERQRKELISLFGAEGMMYIVLGSFTYEKGDERQLYAWDLQSDSMRLMDIDGLLAAAPGAPGSLLLAFPGGEGEGAVWKPYDLSAGKLDDIVINSPETMYAPAVSPLTGGLYYVTVEGAVNALDAGGKTEQKAFVPVSFPRLASRAFFLDASRFVYVDNGVYVRDVSSAGSVQQTSLRIMGQMDGRLIQRYAALHPDVAIGVGERASGFLQFQESMLSRDSGIDIYILNTAQFYHDAREKGFADTLDDNTALRDLSGRLYPAIREALTREGRLVAFPLSITVKAWAINRTRWEALDMGGYPATYEELLQRAQEWQDSYSDAYPDHSFLDTAMGMTGLLSDIVYQYLLDKETEAEAVSFDTPAFRAALDALDRHKALFDNPMDGVFYPLIMPTLHGLGLQYLDADEAISILPPAVDEGSPRLCGAEMEVMILNPLSQNKDAARDFIAFCAGQANIQTQYTLYADKTQPFENPDLEENLIYLQNRIDSLTQAAMEATGAEKTELERQLAYEKERYQINAENKWLISPEWIGIKDDILSRFAVPVRSIFMNSPYSERDEAIMSALSLFTGSDMSIDMLIDQLDSIARIQFMEDR